MIVREYYLVKRTEIQASDILWTEYLQMLWQFGTLRGRWDVIHRILQGIYPGCLDQKNVSQPSR